ncbi:MAG: hypothetical protein Q8O76_04625, partial [Chloroflexota bacterium]|nr:hypothetical protein [Chloroflexota bacterium]
MTRVAAVLALFLLIAPLLASACGGGGEEKPAATGTPAATVELPEGFPEDFPTFEKATLTVATRTTTPQGERFVVQMQTQDSAETVRAFYEKALAKDPWQVDNVLEIPDQPVTVIAFA